MALHDKQRLKKLERKKNKRKTTKKITAKNFISTEKTLHYANHPIHECIVPVDLFTTGIGIVSIARRLPKDEIVIAGFTLDVFCLGVKNAIFNVLDEPDYDFLKSKIWGSRDEHSLKLVDPMSARKLIEGAVAYAKNLGFKPHRDYKNTKGIFGSIDSKASPVKYDFGKDGMPFYIQGPNESEKQARNIVDKLYKRCGEGHYHFLLKSPTAKV